MVSCTQHNKSAVVRRLAVYEEGGIRTKCKKGGISVKRKLIAWLLVLVLCAGITVPVMAATWTIEQTARDPETAEDEAGVYFWKDTLQIDTVRSAKFVNDSKYDVICYCDAPARITLLTTVYCVDLGSSVQRCTVGEDGETIYGDFVERVQKVAAYTYDGVRLSDSYSGAGTCWELPEGIYYMFGMAGGSLYLVVSNSENDPAPTESEEPEMPSVSFTDVTADSWCYTSVCWAVQQQITNGTGNNLFSPTRTCSQAEIITFLWRAAGQPEMRIGINPYNHAAVTEEQYYYQALLWAWGEGLVRNVELDPHAACKRSDVVTYLWKLAKKPTANAANFTDVPADAAYADAVAWAVETGITKGTGNNEFSPATTCTREQIVTFLYRYFVGA